MIRPKKDHHGQESHFASSVFPVEASGLNGLRSCRPAADDELYSYRVRLDFFGSSRVVDDVLFGCILAIEFGYDFPFSHDENSSLMAMSSGSSDEIRMMAMPEVTKSSISS